MKAELFDIEKKRDDQIAWTSSMTANARLLLSLDLIDLIDLSIALSKDKTLVPYHNDSIEWIELKMKDAK